MSFKTLAGILATVAFGYGCYNGPKSGINEKAADKFRETAQYSIELVNLTKDNDYEGVFKVLDIMIDQCDEYRVSYRVDSNPRESEMRQLCNSLRELQNKLVNPTAGSAVTEDSQNNTETLEEKSDVTPVDNSVEE